MIIVLFPRSKKKERKKRKPIRKKAKKKGEKKKMSASIFCGVGEAPVDGIFAIRVC